MTTPDSLETHAAEPRPDAALTRTELRRRRAAWTSDQIPPLSRAELRRRRDAASDRENDESLPPAMDAALAPAVTKPVQRAGPQQAVRSLRRRIGKKLLAVGTLAVASSFMVGMTIPAATVDASREDLNARFAPTPSAGTAAADIQAYVVPEDTAGVDLGRLDGYSVTSVAQLAAAAGIRYFSGSLLFDPDAEVQWPFPVSVPTSSSFGPRWGRMHEGADFTPGEGAQIRAVAGGMVRIATENGGAFGVTVYIESTVDGQTVFSRYAHMLRGSLSVREGETVSAGDVVGRVGNTGRSFGAHLHLEVSTEDGVVDPFAWLQEKTGD